MNSTVLMTTRSPTNPESSTETAALQILKIKMEKVLMEVLEVHKERVCWWENENVTETEGLSEDPDGNQRYGGSGVEPPFSISAS
ncbi:hypothetical protein DPX16_11062 [Anabarilius grahami]|uniref:Uncharacterized protein n=1 Tax=Anabarilius grahami TaxID=495550 RepID=A0A3N0Y239_ANAGA|nr:hypothetical protein DPX16_11062 [Anabarilius grahami]